MLNAYNERTALPLESASERGFAEVLHYSISNPTPELLGWNPYRAAATNHSCRPLGGAGHL